VSSRENELSQQVSRLRHAVNLDMADWWEPTAASYFSHVSKDRIIEVVAQAISPESSSQFRTISCLKSWEVRLRGIGSEMPRFSTGLAPLTGSL
jgi:hypothetical protein